MEPWYFIIVFVALGENAEIHHRFGYKSEEQKAWSEHSEECAGNFQSPIYIVSHRTVPLPLPALEKINYHDLLPLPLCVANTGHSVALEVGAAAMPAEQRPRVFGAALSGSYELEGLHFHWGHRNSRGSEHVLSGIRFPLEMHIIHRKTRYHNVQEALKHPDGLAVLAFFFQARERSNRRLWPVLRLLRQLRRPGQRACLARPFALSALLDGCDTDSFYAYRGSLTTPPCSEAVVWLVFPDPLYISYNQMKRFRRLQSDEDIRLLKNYRLPQPLNNRIVYKRDPWKHNADGRNTTHVDSIKWVQYDTPNAP